MLGPARANAVTRSITPEETMQRNIRSMGPLQYLGQPRRLLLVAPQSSRPFHRNPLDGRALCSKRMELDMDQETKHEIVVLTLGTLAAVPVMMLMGVVAVTGLLAW
jgi:hypothetical protein